MFVYTYVNAFPSIVIEINYLSEPLNTVQLECNCLPTGGASSWSIEKRTASGSVTNSITAFSPSYVEFDNMRTLIFHNVSVDDEGIYHCQQGGDDCVAGCLLVKGNKIIFY